MFARPALPADCGAISEIYSQGIEEGYATFETRPRTAADIEQWLRGSHPVQVVEHDGEVVAFANAGAYSSRECYRGILEFSVYVRRDQRGRGAGKLATQALLDAAAQAGYWKLIAKVFPCNQASLSLLQSLGFREVGRHLQHSRYRGEWWDIILLERLIPVNIS